MTIRRRIRARTAAQRGLVAAVTLLAGANACHGERATRPRATPTPVERASPSPRPSMPPAATTARWATDPAVDGGTPSAPPVSRREARDLVGRLAKDRLGRDLSADERERLADAVVRLRTAARALRATDDSPGGLAERRLQQDAMRNALDDVTRITGIPPSELGTAFDASEETR